MTLSRINPSLNLEELMRCRDEFAMPIPTQNSKPLGIVSGEIVHMAETALGIL